jgi:hypothetical protein
MTESAATTEPLRSWIGEKVSKNALACEVARRASQNAVERRS